MGFKRITKKLVPDLADVDGGIIMVNAFDPQLPTIALFLAAMEDRGHFVVLNKADMVDGQTVADMRTALSPTEVITASIGHDGRGLQEIQYRLSQWRAGGRIVILGVFNAGKTTLINALTGADEPTDDLPGTTLEFKEHAYSGMTLIDSIGQLIDVNMPLMVSVDLDGCKTPEDKLRRVMEVDATAIQLSIDSAMPDLACAVELIIQRVALGNKLVICGAGASGLVAKEMAGQAQETGIPVLCFTNDLASIQPVSFAKGLGEGEDALADYIALAANQGDVVIAVSASGGTGFVFSALQKAQALGAVTIAITENRDTPLGKAAHIVVKSEAKPEGPSSSRIQAAHLAIGHALMVTVADERGIDAEAAVQHMMPQVVKTKKMAIK